MAKAASAALLICCLTVLNELAWHTRIGQEACRDTSPDLSIWSDAGAVAWSNSFEDLGSDHRVLCVTVGEDDCEIDVCLKSRIVDWEQFRKNRQQDKQEGPIEDIGEWCRGLLAGVERVTKEIEWTDWRQEPPKEGDRSSAGGGDGVPEPTRGKRAMVQSQREIVLAFMEQYPELAQKASELQHGLTLAYRRRLWQLTD
ncbi:hypothetical protein HPB50_008725 [Hyalomma asiaticum]|uniref:Uncharacterized protein n=1 Tax=Hyalomma asiaticum TaxID=266040 RepID=A0ACB7TH97_HYAAI|nr:hypothetical protein HPB50_008725 [Hyalomma asiaticum]